ncbi:MAG: hypothetical protein FWD61_03390 [Phycisphaerales bacterium]|nr:hypothetical protein [Phycisphaerales bacterium]
MKNTKKPQAKKPSPSRRKKDSTLFYGVEGEPLIFATLGEFTPPAPAFNSIESSLESADLAGFRLTQDDAYITIRAKATPELMTFLHLWAEIEGHKTTRMIHAGENIGQG